MIHVPLHQSFQVWVLVICRFNVIKLVLSRHRTYLLPDKLLVQVVLVDLSGHTLVNNRRSFANDFVELKILQMFHVE